MRQQRILLGGAAAIFMATIGPTLAAENCSGKEMAAGTKINKENIDCVKEMTFEGKRVGDMITDRIEWQIRNWDLVLDVNETIPHQDDPRLVEATKRYAKSVTLDPDTRNLVNYKTGLPFPEVDHVNDPNAAVKIIWNYLVAHPHGDVQDFNRFAYLLIDGDTGLEREQHWGYVRYWMVGQLRDLDNPIRGDGSLIDKLLIWAWYPQDIKGLGTFTLRYSTGKLPDVWAYVRTVRRIRRLSGGAWFDPIGGTDQLNDDIETFNAHPAWYKDFKVLGRRWVLGVFNSRRPTWVDSAPTPNDRFPRTDLANWPYWNIVDRWELREVYVIEGIPPQEHPYSKKEFYVEVLSWRPVFSDTWDKAGNYWKHMHAAAWQFMAESGYPVMASAWGQIVDFQRRHATIWNLHDSVRTDPPDVDENDVSLQRLEQEAR